MSKTNQTQADIDRTYRARQLERGIVRKTVQVHIEDWPKLQKIAKKMRGAR